MEFEQGTYYLVLLTLKKFTHFNQGMHIDNTSKIWCPSNICANIFSGKSHLKEHLRMHLNIQPLFVINVPGQFHNCATSSII